MDEFAKLMEQLVGSFNKFSEEHMKGTSRDRSIHVSIRNIELYEEPLVFELIFKDKFTMTNVVAGIIGHSDFDKYDVTIEFFGD